MVFYRKKMFAVFEDFKFIFLGNMCSVNIDFFIDIIFYLSISFDSSFYRVSKQLISKKKMML